MTSHTAPPTWQADSHPALESIKSVVLSKGYFEKLAELWAQESNRTGAIELRVDHVNFVKTLGEVEPIAFVA